MKIKSTIGPYITVAILFAAVSIVAQKTTVADYTPGSFKSISRSEVDMLVADAMSTNPSDVKRFTDDPEMKKAQLESLRQLLAFASEAESKGLAAAPVNRQELANIRAEVVAVNYDREINKAKDPSPFSAITSERIAKFWATDAPVRETGFQTFLNAKLQTLKTTRPDLKADQITPEEKEQARDIYAKTKIYEQEYDDKASAGVLPKTLRDKVELQIKLQQAQFLARQYSELLASETIISDADVAAYISAHPEFGSAAQRARAELILKRARSGEDFAKLANEFSEDPGNRSDDGKLNGGLYADVPKGRMIAAFEQGALELKPGEVSGRLIETEYGFHVIKLEKAPGVAPSTETYDVRHILISTMFKDPDIMIAQPVPVMTHVRGILSKEKEKRVMDEIVARNSVSVPSDFTVPSVTPPKTATPKKAAPGKKSATTTVRAKRPVRRKN